MRLLQVTFWMLLLGWLMAPAEAHLYNFTIYGHDPVTAPSGQAGVAPKVLEFSVYIDPLKTNWIAWSQFNTSMLIDKKPVIDAPFKGNEGLRGNFVVQITDPQGRLTPPLTMDNSDEAGNAHGPQAVFYGNREVTPWVVRTNHQGEVNLLNEEGTANDFIREGGIGYYKFRFEFSNAKFATSAPQQQMFMLMDVVEGFRFPDVVNTTADSNWPLNYDPNHDNNDDDDDDNPSPTPTPGPTPTPTVTPTPTKTPYPDYDGFRAGDGFPNAPDNTEPVVPEPTTLALSGLGLALAAYLRRRR
jgi:hypothetical protein